MAPEDCDGPVTLADAVDKLTQCDERVPDSWECLAHPTESGRAASLAEMVEACGAEGVAP
jgi:hypothetical protein